jgi:hypothetical protein
MSLIAVDVVLLPSLSVMDDIIKLINYSSNTVIHLNTQDCLPHITLGEGTVRQPREIITFVPESLALCQLGSYCTVRKVLSEHKQNYRVTSQSIDLD